MESDWEKYIDSLNLKGYQIALGVLSICAIFTILFFLNFYLEGEQSKIEYERVKHRYWHIDDTLNGNVIYIQKYRRGYQLEIVLDDGTIKRLNGKNDIYSNSSLYNFICVDDSLSKVSNSDTLLIYRRSQVFWFIVGAQLDKNGHRY